MINNSTCIQRNIESNENIDKLAQSFFILLVFCSLLSDSYIMFNNFLQNNFIKKNINYYKNIYKIIVGVSFNKYKNDEDGNIIIENNYNVKDEGDDAIDSIDDNEDEIIDNFDEEIQKDLNKILKKTSYSNPFDEESTIINTKTEIVVENTLPSEVVDETILSREVLDETILLTEVVQKEELNKKNINEISSEKLEDNKNTLINISNITPPEIIINKIDEILDNQTTENKNLNIVPTTFDKSEKSGSGKDIQGIVEKKNKKKNIKTENNIIPSIITTETEKPLPIQEIPIVIEPKKKNKTDKNKQPSKINEPIIENSITNNEVHRNIGETENNINLPIIENKLNQNNKNKKREKREK
jgi:hypothetical protein